MSSVAAYGDGLNHKESDPLAPEYHADPYVRHKATTERLLFRMHSQTGLPVVTFRPPFVYGPDNPFYREQFFWDRLRAGRPIDYSGRRPSPDAVRVRQRRGACDDRAMEEPKAIGEAFNIADTKPLTQVEVVEKLAKAANVEPTLARIPRDVIAADRRERDGRSRTISASTSICRPSP